MKKTSLRHSIAVTALAALALTSCEYKRLEAMDAQLEKVDVEIHFDWQNVDSVPGYMRVVFYPLDKRAYSQGYTFFDVLNRDTTVQLPAGIYGINAWNHDTEHVITAGYSEQDKAYATTGNYSPHGNAYIPSVLDSIYYGQRVLDYPDYMVRASQRGFVVEEDSRKRQTLTLTPDSMVVTVDVRLHGISGLEYCYNIRGAVNNLAGKRYISEANLTSDEVAIMWDGVKNTADSLVTSRFWVFGIEPTDLKWLQHKMIFFFWITGNQVYLPIDISNIIARYSKDDRYVLIEADCDLDLKKFVRQGDTGMQVDAEDWQYTKEILLSF